MLSSKHLPCGAHTVDEALVDNKVQEATPVYMWIGKTVARFEKPSIAILNFSNYL